MVSHSITIRQISLVVELATVPVVYPQLSSRLKVIEKSATDRKEVEFQCRNILQISYVSALNLTKETVVALIVPFP